MSSDIKPVVNLVAFFHEELTTAMRDLGVSASEETEAYLVHLLDSFAVPDPIAIGDVGFDRPAAVMLEEAVTSNGERRIEIYRRLGDSSLYSCGFFEERLARRSMDPVYFERMGRSAYQSLSDLMNFKKPGNVFEVIFRELAAKFDEFVRAFRQVGKVFRPMGQFELSQFATTSIWTMPD